MIEVESLTKRYGRATAVDGISFQVEKGEILGFLGPERGRQDHHHAHPHLLPAAHARARRGWPGYDVFARAARGQAARRLPARRRRPSIPDMDVGEFLDFCAKIKGVPGKDAQGADRRRHREVHASATCAPSSSASSPRAIASASGWPRPSSHNPDVLILDEPTAGLDPKQIIETRELIKGLGGDHTIMLSTHILPEVSMTCGRVVIINKGRVVAEDTPDNLTHRLQGAGIAPPRGARRPGPALEARCAPCPGSSPSACAPHGPRCTVFEVEAEAGRDVRAELAARRRPARASASWACTSRA